MTFEMDTIIRFDRPIEKGKHYISPGGYEMVFNGKTIEFDFVEYYGTIDEKDPTLFHILQRYPDYDAFPDINKLTKEDLGLLENIKEFFVYTGEYDDSEINPVKIEDLAFVVFDDNGHVCWHEYKGNDIVTNYKFQEV